MKILLSFTKEDLENKGHVFYKIKEKFDLNENDILEIHLDSNIFDKYADDFNDLLRDTVL